MPKTIAIAARKGGPGKTTLAVNLAAAAGDSTIVDIDPQNSAGIWGDRRERIPTVLTATAARLSSVLKSIQTPWVFIDTAPHQDTDALTAIQLADTVLVPLRPSQPDIDVLPQTLQLLKLANKPAWVILNQLHPSANPTPLMEAIARAGMRVSPIVLRLRSVYSSSFAAGQGVTEYEPGSKAAEELHALWNWIQEII